MHEAVQMVGVWQVEKYESEALYRVRRPYHVATFKNLLVTVGLQAMGRLLTAQGAVTAFSNANAHVGVGSGNTAPAIGQTDLQGASKTRKAMEAGYPLDPTSGVWTWRSVFGTSEANHAWEEFGVFNAAAAGIMLNRALSSQGTKVAGQVWTATATITVT